MSEYPIKIIKSKRKTMCLEIKHDGTLIVRVPFFMRNDDVLKFVNSKQYFPFKQNKKQSG